MCLVATGISHKTASLSIRERFSFSDSNIENSYNMLKGYPCIQESCILSTCNRVELYGVGESEQDTERALKDFLYRSHEILPQTLEKHLYSLSGHKAVSHLMKVAAGLDSMVIGETEILGQIKKAYGEAADAGFAGPYLHKTLQEALRIGKKIHSETAISRGVTSVPGAALELVKRESDLGNKSILVIGAGKMGRLTVAKLINLDLKEVVLINRDLSKAEGVKKSHKIRVSSYERLKEELLTADIVITATASTVYLIKQEDAEEAFKDREKGLLCIDLGVPRNIKESVKAVDGVRLYNVDDLGPIIEGTMQSRLSETTKAEEIIREQLCERLFLV